jgi:hypothetical protein
LPSQRVHKKVAKQLIGSFNPNLHFFIDSPSNSELKSIHRVLFHDADFLKLIKKKLGDEGAREVLLHFIIDLEQYKPYKDRLIKY